MEDLEFHVKTLNHELIDKDESSQIKEAARKPTLEHIRSVVGDYGHEIVHKRELEELERLSHDPDAEHVLVSEDISVIR
ncbi:hypothetical protein A9F13_04g03850 [Clavispora lusitaniae]|uniref:Uncharacterized protein n=1 Tax=Clavispora lusitaniae TaxID=36911 RepID=A0AA91Q2S2_CLALS|nr:hypothetical protein A9F13_04g03850 [Clavispora lusitaniae]